MISNYFFHLYKNTVKESRNFFLTSFEYDPNARLLDCGCWDGVNTSRYGSIIGTKNLYGVEIYKQQAKLAGKKGIKVKLSNLNKKLPFPDNFFDVVIAYHVIEHLVDVKGFASEIHRVLKKGGYIIIGTPNLASWHNIFALLVGLQPFSGPTIFPNQRSGISIVKKLNKKRSKEIFSESETQSLEHIKIMTMKTLVQLFKKNKFKIEEAKGFGYYPLPPPFSRLMSELDPSHSHYVILKARKK